MATRRQVGPQRDQRGQQDQRDQQYQPRFRKDQDEFEIATTRGRRTTSPGPVTNPRGKSPSAFSRGKSPSARGNFRSESATRRTPSQSRSARESSYNDDPVPSFVPVKSVLDGELDRIEKPLAVVKISENSDNFLAKFAPMVVAAIEEIRGKVKDARTAEDILMQNNNLADIKSIIIQNDVFWNLLTRSLQQRGINVLPMFAGLWDHMFDGNYTQAAFHEVMATVKYSTKLDNGGVHGLYTKAYNGVDLPTFEDIFGIPDLTNATVFSLPTPKLKIQPDAAEDGDKPAGKPAGKPGVKCPYNNDCSNEDCESNHPHDTVCGEPGCRDVACKSFHPKTTCPRTEGFTMQCTDPVCTFVHPTATHVVRKCQGGPRCKDLAAGHCRLVHGTK